MVKKLALEGGKIGVRDEKISQNFHLHENFIFVIIGVC